MKKLLLLILIVFPALLYAGETSNAHSIRALFKLGGIWMWFLLGLSVLSLGFIMERLYYFYKIRISSRNFIKNFTENVKSHKDLLTFIKDKSDLISLILKNSFTPHISEDEFERRVERETSVEVNELGRGLNIIGSIGNIAPLLGFLGTVAGMITAFGNIAAADEVSARLVAGGIYTALLTTAFGLVIAIPTIAMYNYFVHKIDTFTADVEKLVNIILNKKLLK